MRRRIVLIAAGLLVAQGAAAQSNLERFLQSGIDNGVAERENQRLQIEIERRDLKEQLRYRRMSTDQIIDEVQKYCPLWSSSCSPPQVLALEAQRRGFLQPAPQQESGSVQAPRSNRPCMTLGLGTGDSIIQCP